MQSFIAFSIGMLRVIAAPSPPSASSHFAFERTPTSLRIVGNGTPVHSAVEVRPCVACTVGMVGFDHSVRPLPEHSRKSRREIEGKRLTSRIEYLRGRATRPWTKSVCLRGSITAVPAWLRSKNRPEGVTMPMLSCSGVKVHDERLVAVLYRCRTSVSNCERAP